MVRLAFVTLLGLLAGVGGRSAVALPAFSVSTIASAYTDGVGNASDSRCAGASDGCAAYDPVATALSSAATVGPAAASAYAELSSGKVGVAGNVGTYQPGPCVVGSPCQFAYGGYNAVAAWSDTLTFTSESFKGQDSLDFAVHLVVHGSWNDQPGNAYAKKYPQLSFSAVAGGNASRLYAQGRYFKPSGPGLGSIPTTTPGGGNAPVAMTASTSDAGSFVMGTKEGNWTQFGPEVFDGTVTVLASNPTVMLQLGLGCGNGCDLSHTGALTLELPQGASYQSASGVFLSDAVAVPEPSSLLLLVGLLLSGVRASVRRRTPAPQQPAD